MGINKIILPGDNNYNIPLDDWVFHLGDIDELNERIFHFSYKAGGWQGNPFEVANLFNGDYEWKNISVPHDWLRDIPIDENGNHENGFKPRGTAWYYTSFNLPSDEIEDARIVFEGILGESIVYVNGILAGRNFSGYNKFSFDVSDYLKEGEKNNIAVYVDGRKWELYTYEGAGIYRPARLEFRNKDHINTDDCFIHAENIDGKWQVAAQLSADNTDGLTIKATIKDENDAIVAEKESTSLTFSIDVEDIKLWSPENPNLYIATYEFYKGCRLVDAISANIGFRTIEWKPNEGMYLNGNLYRIKGICCHQDHAGVGAALTDEVLEYRLNIVKSLGANAYRCAHNDQGENLLKLCDKIGLLVMVENRHMSVSDEVFYQLDALVKTSRNHPSVFLYSLYNEETWHREKRGMKIARKMKDRVKKLDGTRAVTAALDSGTLAEFNTASELDVIGMNYFIREYDETHKRYPDKVIIGSENCPTFSTRGEYVTDKESHVFNAFGEDYPGFSESLNETMEAFDTHPYVGGFFVWNGFDYRGEPNPLQWPSISCHWGFTDYCGFKKDNAYHLMSWYLDEPVVHLCPHWNWKKGDIVKVVTFTNGEDAELFLNGRSLGKETVKGKKAVWNVPFETGELKVNVSFGDKVISDTVKTSGYVSELILEDATPFQSYMHIVNVKAVDKDGIIVPDFSKTVYFSSPDGEIIGVGNGNPTSHHLDSDKKISLFHGLGQVIMKGNELVAECDGIKKAVVKWK